MHEACIQGDGRENLTSCPHGRDQLPAKKSRRASHNCYPIIRGRYSSKIPARRKHHVLRELLLCVQCVDRLLPEADKPNQRQGFSLRVAAHV